MVQLKERGWNRMIVVSILTDVDLGGWVVGWLDRGCENRRGFMEVVERIGIRTESAAV